MYRRRRMTVFCPPFSSLPLVAPLCALLCVGDLSFPPADRPCSPSAYRPRAPPPQPRRPPRLHQVVLLLCLRPPPPGGRHRPPRPPAHRLAPSFFTSSAPSFSQRACRRYFCSEFQLFSLCFVVLLASSRSPRFRREKTISCVLRLREVYRTLGFFPRGVFREQT